MAAWTRLPGTAAASWPEPCPCPNQARALHVPSCWQGRHALCPVFTVGDASTEQAQVHGIGNAVCCVVTEARAHAGRRGEEGLQPAQYRAVRKQRNAGNADARLSTGAYRSPLKPSRGSGHQYITCHRWPLDAASCPLVLPSKGIHAMIAFLTLSSPSAKECVYRRRGGLSFQ
jgi:hypothetical protein